MARRTPTPSRIPSPRQDDAAIAQQSPNPNNCPPPTTGDISAALLDLLRKINSEVPTTPSLQGRALTAVLNFQRISDDLATLADHPASSLSTTGV
jgi:hypothetical protein